MFSTFFTVVHPEAPEIGLPVLATAGEFLLVVNPTGETLRWVKAEECKLGQLYLNQDQREWWGRLASPPEQHPGADA